MITAPSVPSHAWCPGGGVLGFYREGVISFNFSDSIESSHAATIAKQLLHCGLYGSVGEPVTCGNIWWISHQLSILLQLLKTGVFFLEREILFLLWQPSLANYMAVLRGLCHMWTHLSVTGAIVHAEQCGLWWWGRLSTTDRNLYKLGAVFSLLCVNLVHPKPIVQCMMGAVLWRHLMVCGGNYSYCVYYFG